jgi:hypothetical protein
MNIPVPTYQREADFSTITNMILKLEQLADTDKTDAKVIEAFQAKLDDYAKIYQYDEASGSQRYLLYELQALLLQLKGDNDSAQDCLLQGWDLMGPSDRYISQGAKDWVMQHDFNPPQPMSKAQKLLRTVIAWVVYYLLAVKLLPSIFPAHNSNEAAAGNLARNSISLVLVIVVLGYILRLWFSHPRQER